MAWSRQVVVVVVLALVVCGALPPGAVVPDGDATTTASSTTASTTTASLTTASLTTASSTTASSTTASTTTASSTTASLTTASLTTASLTTASSTTDVLSSAGAVFTEEVFTGPDSTWGHGAAGGAAVLPEGAVPRFNLLDGVRRHPPSEACRRALDDVLEASTQLRLWALKMHSSSVMLPDALLAANMYSLGDFDGCLSVPEAVYCLLDVEVRPARQSGAPPLPTHPGDEVSPFEPPHGHNATLWDLLQTSGNRRRFRRDLQQWAVYIPIILRRHRA
ncbi:serine-rich adhesin for platelets-like [Thrips palmi]|uniref:Serine-rich adhesin for platelets-like n=1 Tax=Thrips palmi TaxID=161013 RepID=A0A6P8YRY6_THRPL|nr:serine-rich adhesin for platelets-like [Thrips palmi]